MDNMVFGQLPLIFCIPYCANSSFFLIINLAWLYNRPFWINSYHLFTIICSLSALRVPLFHILPLFSKFCYCYTALQCPLLKIWQQNVLQPLDCQTLNWRLKNITWLIKLSCILCKLSWKVASLHVSVPSSWHIFTSVTVCYGCD